MIPLPLLLGGSALAVVVAQKWLKKSKPDSTKDKALSGTNNPHRFRVRTLLTDLKNAISGTERQQQQMSIEPGLRAQRKQFEASANRNAVLFGVATGIALLGAIYPSLNLLAVVAILYLIRDLFRFVWQDWKRGQFLSVYLIALLVTFGMLLKGYIVLTAIWGVLANLMMTVIKRAEANSQKHLIEVFAGHPPKVWIERDGVELEVEFATLCKGDLVIVNAGEVLPIDGVIESGQAMIDQHLLTGESEPVERLPGDRVYASTLLLSGRIRVRLEAAGIDTVAAGIGAILNCTENYTDNMTARGRQIVDRLLPIELTASAVTWPLLGPTPALCVLWSNLGSSMVMLGPLSVLNYLQLLSRQAILVKDGRVLESLRKIDTVVFDKTGTLTLEQPTLATIHCLDDIDETTLLGYTAAAEYRQPHPIARAILAAAEARSLILPTIDEASYEAGYGIKVRIEGRTVRVGSARFIEREGIALSVSHESIRAAAEANGNSLVYVALDEKASGILELAPTLRPETKSIIAFLHQRGIKTYIISGDREQPTRAMAAQLGIDDYFAETLPEHKADHVRRLRKAGRFVCFIGDGINDAIALKSAQISISLKGATTAATDTAQIVFMDGTLQSLEHLFSVVDEFEETMHTNLLWSVIPGIINTCGVYLLHFGIATSMGIFYSAVFLSIGNTLWPLVKHQKPLTEDTDQP
jgi:Cu2+-exporting ATPase